eukprot:COSAG01_NODE_76_length_28332_cov_298.876992_20_plen_785_part_00
MLTALCNTTRGDTVNCIKCAGHYESYVDEANCTNAQLTNFCLDNSCYDTMQRVCGGTVGKSCGQCATCVAQITHAPCSTEQKRSFCDSGCFGVMYEWNRTQLLLPHAPQHNCTVPNPTQFEYFQSADVAPKLVPTPGYVSMAGTFTSGPVVGSSNQFPFSGGALLPDGRVVFVPANSATIGLYDPSTNTFTRGPAVGSVHAKFFGGTLLPDGRVVLVPSGSATIGLYDPSTNTFTSGPVVGSGQEKFFGGVLLPDGRVVFVPRSFATIGLYDPRTNTFTRGPAVGSVHAKFSAGVLLPDGRVVFVPYISGTIGLYDPSTNTFTSGPGVGPTQGKFTGGVLLPDGRVVFVPDYSGTIGLYDPRTNTFTGGPGHLVVVQKQELEHQMRGVVLDGVVEGGSSATMQCDSNLRWVFTGDYAQCIVSGSQKMPCTQSDLPFSQYGAWSFPTSGSTFPSGSASTFTCEQGYTISPPGVSSYVLCTNGVFSSTSAMCVPGTATTQGGCTPATLTPVTGGTWSQPVSRARGGGARTSGWRDSLERPPPAHGSQAAWLSVGFVVVCWARQVSVWSRVMVPSVDTASQRCWAVSCMVVALITIFGGVDAATDEATQNQRGLCQCGCECTTLCVPCSCARSVAGGNASSLTARAALAKVHVKNMIDLPSTQIFLPLLSRLERVDTWDMEGVKRELFFQLHHIINNAKGSGHVSMVHVGDSRGGWQGQYTSNLHLFRRLPDPLALVEGLGQVGWDSWLQSDAGVWAPFTRDTVSSGCAASDDCWIWAHLCQLSKRK